MPSDRVHQCVKNICLPFQRTWDHHRFLVRSIINCVMFRSSLFVLLFILFWYLLSVLLRFTAYGIFMFFNILCIMFKNITFLIITMLPRCRGLGASMSQVVGSITNTAWVQAQLCKLQKGALDSQAQVIRFTSCVSRVLRLPPPLKLVAMIQLKYCRKWCQNTIKSINQISRCM